MIHRIAIFRSLYLGDMLLAVPALRAIRQRFPHAEITLIGLPWAAAFCERYRGYLNRFVEFAGYPGLREVEVCPERTRAFIEEQRASRYDLVVQMHGCGPASNEFVHELHGRVTVGFISRQDTSAGLGLTIGLPYPEQQHEIYRNLTLAELLGCRQLDPRLEFPVWASDFLEARYLLAAFAPTGGPRIGLHVGAKHPARRWPPAYFAALADALTRDLHAQVVFTGGMQERPLVREVTSLMRTSSIDLSGQTSLGGLAALLSTFDLFISNDTGPAHLAYAMDTPSITFFGPTDYQRWRPLDQQRHLALRVPVDCSPCGYQVCPIDHRCLAHIPPAGVLEAATQCLQDGSLVLRVGKKIPVLPRNAR